MTTDARPRTVFVSGAAGGLGASAALYLARHGWRVFAADLDEEGLAELAREPNITALRMDVTDPASVAAAAAAVADACDGLDGVVNFAGILIIGSVVEIDSEAIRRLLDINVIGTVRVNRALFPLVLAHKGRIVNLSSEVGWQTAMPFNGAYAMSKHAIEAYSDSLRRELMFLGVPVIKIQPGPFRTAMVAGIQAAFVRAADASTHFAAMLLRLRDKTRDEQAAAHDPILVAEAVFAALTEPRPRAAYSILPNRQNGLLSLMPTQLADLLIRKALGPAS